MLKSGPVTSGLVIGLMRLGNAGIGLLSTVVLTRALSLDDFGRYAYLVVILSIVAVPISRGWGNLLLRSASAAQHSGDWREPRGIVIRGSQLAILFAAFVGSGVVVWYLSRSQVGGRETALVAIALVVALACDQLSALRMQWLRGMDRPVLAQLPEMLIRPTVMIGAVTLAWLWRDGAIGLETAVGTLAVASFVALLSGAAVLRRISASVSLRTQAVVYRDRLWIRSATLMAANALLFVLGGQLDILVLGALTAPGDIAIYRVAVQVATFSALAYMSLNIVALQRFAYCRAAGDTVSLQATAKQLARVAFVFTSGVTLTVALAADWLLPLLFGSVYEAAYWPTVLLCTAQCVSGAFGMPYGLLTMSGREDIVLRLTTVTTVLNLALCLAVIPSFGAVGAACATLVSTALLNLGLWHMVRTRLSVDTSII